MAKGQISPAVLITGAVILFVVGPALLAVVSTTVGDVKSFEAVASTAEEWGEGTLTNVEVVGDAIRLVDGADSGTYARTHEATGRAKLENGTVVAIIPANTSADIDVTAGGETRSFVLSNGTTILDVSGMEGGETDILLDLRGSVSGTYNYSDVTVEEQETFFPDPGHNTPADVSADGTIFAMGNASVSGAVHQWRLSDPFNISTRTLSTHNIPAAEVTGTINGVEYGKQGEKVYVTGDPGATLNAWDLAEPYNISTRANKTELDIDVGLGDRVGVTFSDDGSLLHTTHDFHVVQWELGAPWEPSTALNNDTNLSVVDQEFALGDIDFNGDGTELHLIGGQRTLFVYDITDPFNISTATYNGKNVSINYANFGWEWANGGRLVYAIDGGSSGLATQGSVDVETASPEIDSYSIEGTLTGAVNRLLDLGPVVFVIGIIAAALLWFGLTRA